VPAATGTAKYNQVQRMNRQLKTFIFKEELPCPMERPFAAEILISEF